ncbi:MAG: hypothetical protein HRU14_16315, partial [Planctomycetes bacterium]|nr:hypothetical protein [Planctomycetota bacterium]
MRAIPLALITLLCVGLAPAQTPVLASSTRAAAAPSGVALAAADALATLRASLKVVMGYGRSAEKPLVKLRRTQPVKAAVSLMRFVSKKLRKMEKPDPEPDADKVLAACKAFSEQLGAFLNLAEKGFDAAAAAVATAEGLEKEFLQKLHARLYAQVAYLEITSYFVGDTAPGTFDGMFPRTEKLGRAGAKAMLDLFVDLDQLPNVRALAGEGVAQLGSKEDVGAVTDIHEDQLEEPTLRNKAMFVLARLGDLTAFNKKVASTNAAIKDLEKKRDDAEAGLKKLAEDLGPLSKVENPTAEQKERLAKLRKEIQEADGVFARLISQVGGTYNAKAQFYLELRDNKETEVCYATALKNWMRIASRLQGPRSRNSVNIVFYNLACVQSLQGRTEQALGNMDNAFKWGYRNFDWCMKDGDLAEVRKGEGLAALVEEVRSGKAAERWKKEAG